MCQVPSRPRKDTSVSRAECKTASCLVNRSRCRRAESRKRRAHATQPVAQRRWDKT